MSRMIVAVGPAGVLVRGKKAHLAGPSGQPLCDLASYRGHRWWLALDDASLTCQHCRRAFGLVEP